MYRDGESRAKENSTASRISYGEILLTGKPTAYANQFRKEIPDQERCRSSVEDRTGDSRGQRGSEGWWHPNVIQDLGCMSSPLGGIPFVKWMCSTFISLMYSLFSSPNGPY